MQEKRLEIFLAVAMSKNFAKAAAMLNVTPSNISRELKNLEEEMGMTLVDRQKGVKTAKLTPAGESFLLLVLKWQEINKEIANSCIKQQACFLSIAGCETANNNLLPPVFNKMLSHSPPVYLKITTDPTDMLYEKVETREIDAAFVVHQEASKLVKITPFYRDVMMVVRYEGKDGDETDSDELRPEDLNPKDELYIEWSHEYRLWHHSVWDPSGPVIAELLTAYLVPGMMNTKGRWAIVPKCVTKDFQNMEKYVKFYRLSVATPDLIFYKVTHRTPKISALAGLAILDDILAETTFPVFSGVH